MIPDLKQQAIMCRRPLLEILEPGRLAVDFEPGRLAFCVECDLHREPGLVKNCAMARPGRGNFGPGVGGFKPQLLNLSHGDRFVGFIGDVFLKLVVQGAGFAAHTGCDVRHQDDQEQ